MKIRPVETELILADGRTDVATLMGAHDSAWAKQNFVASFRVQICWRWGSYKFFIMLSPFAIFAQRTRRSMYRP